MRNDEQIKNMVREKYSEIALQDKDSNSASCCGSGCCSMEVYNIMTDDYSAMKGYEAEADLGLGCGLPMRKSRSRPNHVAVPIVAANFANHE